MKKVAVNTRFLLKDKLEGIGWFTHEILKRLVLSHPEIEFHFLFDRAYDESFIYADNVIPHVLFPPARHPFLWYWWFEYSVSNVLIKINPDVFLSTDGYACLSTDIPQNTVIHDLAFEHYPKDLDYLKRKYYTYYTPKFANKATRITTVSEFTKSDIVDKYQIDANKIDVVYNGINTKYTPLSLNEIKGIRETYSDGEPYFLFIGALHPRKNIVRLLKAFDKLKALGYPHKMLLVGRMGWGTDEISQTFDELKHKEDIIRTGRLSETELAKVLGAAFAMTYVPYLEGFGIPIIEAQTVGVPVITSDCTSMPEVAGKGSAVLVNPFDVDSIYKGMKRLVEDKGFYQKIKHLGLDNVKRFSWNKTADLLWSSLLKTV